MAKYVLVTNQVTENWVWGFVSVMDFKGLRQVEKGLEVVQGSKTRYLFHAAPTKDALWYPLQKNILILL